MPKAQSSADWQYDNYKIVLKAYIYDRTAAMPEKDRIEYFETKKKEGSLRHRHSNVFAIDDQYNVINFGGASLSRELLVRKYGDSLKKFVTAPSTTFYDWLTTNNFHDNEELVEMGKAMTEEGRDPIRQLIIMEEEHGDAFLEAFFPADKVAQTKLRVAVLALRASASDDDASPRV